MKKHLLVVQSTNYRWILGHWVRQLKLRLNNQALIYWVPISFTKTHMLSNFVKSLPLPKFENYYFTFPTIFENYLKVCPKRVKDNSIVLYTHNDQTLGTNEHQVSILSNARKVHFMCSRDAERLITFGLPAEKCRIILGAVDTSCYRRESLERRRKSILLSSKFGSRKGANFIPELIERLPDWHFTIIGTGWEEFIYEHSLTQKDNFSFFEWSESARNLLMSENSIFLSLSTLEGGPIPLIDALACGMYGISTDTGFARDVIMHRVNGELLPENFKIDAIIRALMGANMNEFQSIESVRHLTWDRITKYYLEDSKN